MTKWNARNLTALGAISLTILIAVLQLTYLCQWSKEEFHKSSCKHSKAYYRDLHVRNETASKIECEKKVDDAVIMNVVGITGNVISILLSLLATVGVGEFFGVVAGSRSQKGIILPYCFYHFIMIPISVFSDIFFSYIPLAAMIIGIGLYLAFIAIVIAYLRSVTKSVKKLRAANLSAAHHAPRSANTKPAANKKSGIESGSIEDEMFYDFSYKKMKPAFFSSD